MKHGAVAPTIAITLATTLASAACGRGSRTPQVDPAALAAIHSELRLVSNETTWVARGTGYELVGRTNMDLAMVQPQLSRDAAILARVFPADSVKTVVATIRRVAPEGKPFIPRAPLPQDTRGADRRAGALRPLGEEGGR